MEGRPPHEVFKAGIQRKRTRKPSASKEVKKNRVGPDLGEAGCQAITVPVESDTVQASSLANRILTMASLLLPQ